MDGGSRILILAGDSDGNIGDRAIVYAMCRQFRSVNPSARIHILSSNPDVDRAYFKAATIPRGIAGLLRFLSAVQKSHVILCGGGGLFQDDDSLAKMPYWFCRIALVRLLKPKAPLMAYSLGVGPLRRPLSRLLARLAFACMDRVSVRDRLAQDIAASLTSKPVRIVPDPALLLPPASPEKARSLLAERGVPLGAGPLVGVAVRQWFHQKGSVIPHKYAVKYRLRKISGAGKCDRMVRLLAEVLDELAERENAYILFLPTYNVAHEADDAVCRRIAGRMKTHRKKIIRLKDPAVYKAVTGRLAVMLGGRMHPTIFSAGMGTPIVGLSYNQKFRGFFELLGLAENVMDVAEFVEREQVVELSQLLSQAIRSKTDATRRVRRLSDQIKAFNLEIMAPETLSPR